MIKNSFSDQYHQKAEELKGFVPESLDEIKEHYQRAQRFTKTNFKGYKPDRQAMLAGQCSGSINTILSSQEIMDQMISEARTILKKMPHFTQAFSKNLKKKVTIAKRRTLNRSK
tara:strand:- start:244 stop:585 length:342 start_codon:yes stop_codon:yes gene_type:complete